MKIYVAKQRAILKKFSDTEDFFYKYRTKQIKYIFQNWVFKVS